MSRPHHAGAHLPGTDAAPQSAVGFVGHHHRRLCEPPPGQFPDPLPAVHRATSRRPGQDTLKALSIVTGSRRCIRPLVRTPGRPAGIVAAHPGLAASWRAPASRGSRGLADRDRAVSERGHVSGIMRTPRPISGGSVSPGSCRYGTGSFRRETPATASSASPLPNWHDRLPDRARPRPRVRDPPCGERG